MWRVQGVGGKGLVRVCGRGGGGCRIWDIYSTRVVMKYEIRGTRCTNVCTWVRIAAGYEGA